MKKGKLYLIPSLLGDSDIHFSLPNSVQKQIQEINIFIVENIRSARRFIRKVDKEKNIDNCTLYAFGKHNKLNLEENFLSHILNGENVGIISEAGFPCVADPGAKIVAYAHDFQIDVIPLVGPSSIFLALMASGLNGQNFVFHGYLPIEKKERGKKIKQMESNSRKENQSQIFMETPYRNHQLLEAIIKNCSKKARLCIATNISLSSENIKTKTIDEWKRTKLDIHKKPTIFLLLAK
ncbi:MAG: SAM-dependent methyltransferase [Bacteroidota bacterium]|nr:SAM-dependent methyltransferase [Bacteroidota bacterium]